LRKFQTPTLYKPWDLENCLLHKGSKLTLQTYSSRLRKHECLGRCDAKRAPQTQAREPSTGKLIILYVPPLYMGSGTSKNSELTHHIGCGEYHRGTMVC